ncbi:MAG: histidine--tRNA ligase, partial [Elusimicrobia bacterium]|nr:histidine--tRNA ligase [Elusimicrobiota bacterium]
MSPAEEVSGIQAARGMRDSLPPATINLARIESAARERFSLFGYREIRTPVLEPLSLFQRALGQSTDIVEKEMFTLQDRGERALCLRPEGTAGVVRSYIENAFDKTMAIPKLYYIGPMFRAERPQAGRYREFNQIGSEYFGNESPASDAETIQLAAEILRASGLDQFEIRLNSLGCAACRSQYKKVLLEFLKGVEQHLCEDCRKRIQKNPLRALDCKTDKEKLKDAPQTLQTLCADCKTHHEDLQNLLSLAEIPFQISPQLVRGLDYYTRTVFEVYPAGKTGSQDALAAGGRYDGLVEELGGPKAPAVGFAMGIERVMNALEHSKTQASEERKGIFVIALGKEAIPQSFRILTELRGNGLEAEGVLNQQSIKSQMRLADSLGKRFCLIV